MGREVSVLWPLITAGIVLLLVTVVAVRVFEGKEL